MNNIQIYAQRNIKFSEDFGLEIDGKLYSLQLGKLYQKAYNIRFIIEFSENTTTYSDLVFGTKVFEKNIETLLTKQSKIKIKNKDLVFNEVRNAISKNDNYYLNCNVFEDLPINSYEVLQAIPLPINIITFYFVISTKKSIVHEKKVSSVQKIFDGYSHLGFLLTNLPKMKEVIEQHYGKEKLDLVNEFTNTEIIDRLFESGCLIIIWGINPFTYPIYFSSPDETIKTLLGEELAEGKYTINPNINDFSLVPGHKLRDWPNLLNESYPTIKLNGFGNTAHLKAFGLKDESSIIIPSFLIYRSDDEIIESSPLVNVDLLYS